TGSAGLLLVRADEVVLTTDGRYRDQSAEQLEGAGVEARVEVRPTLAGQGEVLTGVASGIARLGLEADSVTWGQQRRFAADWFAGSDLVPTEGLAEELRRVKVRGEVARLGEAAGIADRALAAVRTLLAEGLIARAIGFALVSA